MQSESIGALAAALAKAQGAIKPAVFDKEVNTNTYKFKYATLATLWDTARDALAINGLAVTQTTDIDSGGNILLVTTLLHASGEWIGGVYPVRAKDNMPQTLGSAITYARRYALSAILGLVSDDDDDGNAANGNQAQHKPAAQAPKPNGAPRQATPPHPADDEHSGNPFTDDEKLSLAKLNAIGADLYRDKWGDDKRHELVKQITKGRTSSSKQLSQDEFDNLCAWMSKKIEERKAKQAVTA